MTTTPKWFKPVALIAFLWNLLGCIAFIPDIRLTPDDMAKMSTAQQALYAARPLWSVIATGVAVGAGALGCVGLFLGKRWSYPLLWLSLLGVILQDISLFGMTGAMSEVDSTVVILQSLVLLIALALLLLARKAIKRDWIR